MFLFFLKPPERKTIFLALCSVEVFNVSFICDVLECVHMKMVQINCPFSFSS